MVSLKSLSWTCFRFKQHLPSQCLSSFRGRREIVSSWTNCLVVICWFIELVWDLDQICDEFVFSLIGESITSLIVEYQLWTNRTQMFCVVGMFPWLFRHDGLLFPINYSKGSLILWNKRSNLKPPWLWGTIVFSLLQRDGSRLYLIIGGKMNWLYEDMWWTMMVSNDNKSQYEGILWKWTKLTTKHVISCSGNVWNGQQCNRWIVPPDLLSVERCWITMDDSETQDHIRPRTTIEKVSESVCVITFLLSCST
ncbi:hypothetical protein HA466_0012010 [Hirschfeldia incana]|nr:hypothetical protein HA466_0012010 [Hirschfeldia incana]